MRGCMRSESFHKFLWDSRSGADQRQGDKTRGDFLRDLLAVFFNKDEETFSERNAVMGTQLYIIWHKVSRTFLHRVLKSIFRFHV